MPEARSGPGSGEPRLVSKTYRDVWQLLVRAERKMLDDPPGLLILAAVILLIGLALTLVWRLSSLPVALLAAVRTAGGTAAAESTTFDHLATETFGGVGEVGFFSRSPTEHLVRLLGAGYLLLAWLLRLIGFVASSSLAIASGVFGYLGGAHLIGERTMPEREMHTRITLACAQLFSLPCPAVYPSPAGAGALIAHILIERHVDGNL